MEAADLLKTQRQWYREQIAAIDELLGPEQDDLFGGKTQGELAKQKHDKEASEGLKRIRRIFATRDSTIPDKAIVKSYNALAKRLGKSGLYEEVATIARFYGFRKEEIERGNANLWPGSAQVLINKWGEVLDRANTFLAAKPKSVDQKERPKIIEPEHWRYWANDNWDKKGDDYWQDVEFSALPFDIQLEIHRKCR